MPDVTLVLMRRDKEQFPPPHTADVHPDEVANWGACGWVVDEGAIAPQDGEDNAPDNDGQADDSYTADEGQEGGEDLPEYRQIKTKKKLDAWAKENLGLDLDGRLNLESMYEVIETSIAAKAELDAQQDADESQEG